MTGCSRRHFGGVVGPEAERAATGMAVGSCGESVTAGTEDQVDRAVSGEKSLGLPMRLEPPEYLLSLSCRPVRPFDCVIQSLVSAVISVRCQRFDRLDIAAQFVRDHDLRRAELGDEPFEKPLFGLSASARLHKYHKYIENIAIRVNRAPQLMLVAMDRNSVFVEVPFVVGTRAITPDATREMATKSIDPQPDGLPADNHAPLSQKILNVSRAQREPVVRPNSIGNDFSRETEAIQAGHSGRSSYTAKITRSCRLNKLAVPYDALST